MSFLKKARNSIPLSKRTEAVLHAEKRVSERARATLGQFKEKTFSPEVVQVQRCGTVKTRQKRNIVKPQCSEKKTQSASSQRNFVVKRACCFPFSFHITAHTTHLCDFRLQVGAFETTLVFQKTGRERKKVIRNRKLKVSFSL